QLILWALNRLPQAYRVKFVTLLVRIYFSITPSHGRVGLKNLGIAFPEKAPQWRKQILRKSYEALGRLIVDFARLPELDRNWVVKHIEEEFADRNDQMRAKFPGKGVVYATGHLGSFELLAHCAALYGFPLDFVVRNATLPSVDKWWRAQREANG